MDPVDNLTRIIETLRLAAGHQAGRAAHTTAGKNAGSAPSDAGNAGADELQEQLVEKLRTLKGDDQQRRQKGARILLDAVLRREYGDALLNDPALGDLVHDIQVTMEEDPSMRAALDEVIDQLCG